MFDLFSFLEGVAFGGFVMMVALTVKRFLDDEFEINGF